MDRYSNLAVKIFNDIVDGVDGTLDVLPYELPKHGYFVGGHGEALVFESTESANHSTALTKILEFVKTTEARFVGYWTDSETGKVYVDGTDWFPGNEYDRAEQACRERGEIAFWSIADQREFRPVALADKEV